MLPLNALPASASSLSGLLFDVDDTVLDAGRLSVQALEALYAMSGAGLCLVGVTGRPTSWGQVLARQWPVDGMVTENGAIAIVDQGGRLELLDRVDADERKARRRRLESLVAQMREHFEALEPSDDVMGRISDYTFDVGESRAVPPTTVQAAARFARSRGARVVQSSIHLHVTLDGDDKATGALRLLRRLRGVDPTSARQRFAFVGDSGNDAPCFAAFHHSFGVANLSGRPSLPPRYVASQPSGKGFSEVAHALLAARSSQPSRSRAPSGSSF